MVLSMRTITAIEMPTATASNMRLILRIMLFRLDTSALLYWTSLTAIFPMRPALILFRESTVAYSLLILKLMLPAGDFCPIRPPILVAIRHKPLFRQLFGKVFIGLRKWLRCYILYEVALSFAETFSRTYTCTSTFSLKF